MSKQNKILVPEKQRGLLNNLYRGKVLVLGWDNLPKYTFYENIIPSAAKPIQKKNK